MLKLDFVYDFMGRRVQKIVSIWNVATNGYVPSTTNLFVYDGWNLLAIINQQSSILQSFMWGQDISGAEPGDRSEQSGCGIGGLLMECISATNCFIGYDGNGNITLLINTTDKSLAARYEYSPYGELLRATGLLGRQNPFRFSTKFADEESGLIYYGCRYNNPSIGRWLNRDPLGDIFSSKTNNYFISSRNIQASIQVYGFVNNSPLCMIDPNGFLAINVCGMIIGWGPLTYDFTFSKNDWEYLRDYYTEDIWVSGVCSATGNKACQVTKYQNKMLLCITAANDGYFVGSVLGRIVCDFNLKVLFATEPDFYDEPNN